MPIREVEQSVAALRRWSMGVMASASLAVLGLSWGVVSHIVSPVLALSNAAESIARGDYSQRAYVSNRDELGTLATSFNRMSQELGAQLTAMRDLGERQTLVLGGMVEGVIAIDDREHILFANSAAGELFGFLPPVVEGRPLLEVVRNHTLHEAVGKALTEGAPQRLEIEWQGPEKLTLSVQISPLAGVPSQGAVLVLHDTTELRRLERIRQEFVANVSHELKTPLSSIKAYTETLLDGALHDEQHAVKFLRRIEEQADRLHALIQDMLSLARIESAQQPFEITAVNISEAVAACVDDYRAQAEAKRIELAAESDEPLLEASADPEGLRVILNNLVDNAIKYTPPGGRVTLRWRQQGERHVRIEVEDTGIGIPRDELPRVFERFYRVDKARSRELGGTGLGLSIVKHLAQSFHGAVSVTSTLDEGTTFAVRLPLAG